MSSIFKGMNKSFLAGILFEIHKGNFLLFKAIKTEGVNLLKMTRYSSPERRAVGRSSAMQAPKLY